MALNENIYKLRLEKLKQIEALGQQAYPTKYDFTHTIPQILAPYSSNRSSKSYLVSPTSSPAFH